jgi:hypothetical protein
MSYRLTRPKKGEFPVLIGKPSPEEERDFYDRTSGGFVSYFRGSSPNLGSPRSQDQEGRQRPGQASKPCGRGRRKAP